MRQVKLKSNILLIPLSCFLLPVAMPSPPGDKNKISAVSEAQRLMDIRMRDTVTAACEAHAKAEADRQRQFEARVAISVATRRVQGGLISFLAAPATPGSSTLGGGGSPSSVPDGKPPPPMPGPLLAPRGTPLAEVGGRPLPLPIPAGHSTPSPIGTPGSMGPPQKACPATRSSPAASPLKAPPLKAPPLKAPPSSAGVHSAPGSCTLGAGDLRKGWDGPKSGTPGTILGGLYKPASVAPSTASAFHQPVGAEGQSNRMCRCRDKDRGLLNFPKAAFELLAEDDPPQVDSLGPDGPGWYPKLFNSEQWYGDLYPLETGLPAFDFVHWASARDESCIRKLMLGQVDLSASHSTSRQASTSLGPRPTTTRTCSAWRFSSTAFLARKIRAVIMVPTRPTTGTNHSPAGRTTWRARHSRTWWTASSVS